MRIWLYLPALWFVRTDPRKLTSHAHIAQLGPPAVSEPECLPDLLPPREVAKKLAISEQLVYRMIRLGEIECVDIGTGGKRAYRIDPEQIRLLLARRKVDRRD